MDESSRVPQRSRPRPYDLRRKVLLKNFLREQMTHIPLPPPRLPMEDDSIADDEVSSTVGNEENIGQPSNVQEMPNHKQESASLAPEPIASTSTSHITSTEDSPDSSTSQQLEMEVDKNTQPTFTRLSNLLKLKINSVRSRRKGITKAKLKLKAKSPAQKSLLRVTNNAEQCSKGKAKSIFTLFKARRGKRNLKSPTRISSPVSKSTSTQSVQTDVSFTQDEFNNMEQSNRCLREENRLLSESLSSFMSDFDLKLSPLKIPYGTDSYITSSGSSQATTAPQQTSSYVAKRLDYNDNERIKIPRSKSMQDRLDKRFPNRSRPIRTRSMNYGLTKRFYDSSSLQQRDPHPYRRNFNSETSNNFYNSSPRRGKHRPNSFSSFDSNPNRISIPEPNSRMLPHRASVLKNLPINNSSRAIVRRSSMPERTSYQPTRPLLRHKSTRVNGYDRGNVYNNDHNYNVANGNVPIRRRSNSNGDYGRPVPFQSLPPEAFY